MLRLACSDVGRSLIERYEPGLSQQEPISRLGVALNVLVSRYGLRLVLFAVWLAVVVASSAHHAFWRDEVRALSLARQGEGLTGMMNAVHGEGHPALWYLLLRVAYSIAHDTVVLPIISILVASFAILILLLLSPFPVGFLALLLLSKFALFEYSVMARNYGISMLLIFGLAALYPRHRDQGIALGLLLFLLANTNAHSTLLVAAFLLFWLIDTVWKHGLRWTPALRAVMLNTCLAIAGVALCAATIYPTFNDAAAVDNGSAFSPRTLLAAVANPAGRFEDLMLRSPWEALRLGPFHAFSYRGTLQWLMSLLMFGSLLGLVRRPAALVGALFALVSFSLFFAVVYVGAYRHEALWLVFLVAMYWIVMLPDAGTELTWPERFEPLVRRVRVVGITCFTLVLVLQLPGGVATAADTVLHGPPFSASREFAALVASEPTLAGATIIADPDFLLEPVPYYMTNPTYLIRESRFGSVVKFTQKARLRLTLDDLLVAARRIEGENSETRAHPASRAPRRQCPGTAAQGRL